ncbi:hypothetical protein DFH07DRAFT_778038 [Mycena maculata]|uniref:Uncharacterized protein n=1 Tax=Mycena maculata TaxID=230809 RepID=A0AAD7IFP9_9AGAR|nr:hypothetical protein DFH07DRAFT_778038 [Mycena maculata]
MDLYHEEKAHILGPKEHRKGLQKICEGVEQEYYAKHRWTITISPVTVGRHAKGGGTRSTSNAEKGWLEKEEVETVIAYTLEVASHGKDLEISFRRKMCWPTPLDNKRGRAVNPFTNEAYFDLLEDVLAGNQDYQFDQELRDDSGPPPDFVSGLDVVIFSLLKRYWTEEKTKFECTSRQKMDKMNFLKIYGQAHVRALTKSNIKAAFRKTGLWPFNYAVITPEMMAPSIETAAWGHLPIALNTPIRVVTDMIHQIHQRAKCPLSPDDVDEVGTLSVTQHQPSLAAYLNSSLQTIRTSSSSFLVTSSPVQSTSAPPAFVPVQISPYQQKKAHYAAILAVVPTNVIEEELQNSVRELLASNKQHKVRRVVAFHEAAEAKEVQMVDRQATRAERNDALVEWKELEQVRKEENKVIQAWWHTDVKAWEAERDRAKIVGKRPSWKKPVLKGQLFSPVPKPRYVGNTDTSEVASASTSNQPAQSRQRASSDNSDSSKSEEEDQQPEGEDELEDEEQSIDEDKEEEEYS